jgi:sugar phosphate isomerase/epimerase
MTNWPVGLSTGCFYDRNILECLELIRESGFSMVEVCSSPAHLDYHDLAAVRAAAQRIEVLGMEAYSFHAPFADHIDIASPDEGRRRAGLEEIIQAAEAAALLQVQYFVVHPGPESRAEIPAEERLARMEHVAATLNLVAQRCRALGLGCVLENKLPHLLFGHTSDILWILDAIDTPGVGACLDTGHAALAGDMYHLVQKLSGHLRMLHVHDNSGNADDHRPPGDGTIEWERLLRGLVEINFRGALILELGKASDDATTMANARRGRSYLREQARQIAASMRR